MGPNQTYKLLHSTENHKKNKKTACRVWEIICKWLASAQLPKHTNIS